MFAALWQAWHSWKSARAVAALAALACAVGIGSATAIYTVVHGVLLKPLPYPGGDRLVALYGARFSEPDQRSAHTFPDLIEYQQRARSFDVFGWFRQISVSLTFGAQAPQHIVGAAVTPILARGLGVSPMIGTWFADDQSVVLGYALWRRLGQDPAIAGKTVTLDGRPYTVTGVMPAGFRLPVPGPGVEHVRSEIWIPLDPLGRGQPRSEGAFFSYGRLKPGVTFAQAREDVTRVAAEIAALDPPSHPSYTARLDDLSDSVVSEIRPTLMLLIAASGLLLVITCVDVAGLLLARAVARARETAIRVALGARRRQLAVHYFLEALIVAIAGAAVGVLVAIALVRGVLAIAADYIPRADEIALDWTVFAFAFAVAALASAIASLAPLGQAFRTAPVDVLSAGVRASASRRSRRLSQSLVVAEIALAFTLLATSAVLVAHLRNLGHVFPGFNANDLLTFRVTAPPDVWSRSEARVAYQRRLVSALEGVPGATSVAFTNQLPLEGCCFGTTIFPDGRPADLKAVERISFLAVSPGYFRTLQIPLRAGRYLDERDTSEDVVLVDVNEAAVRAYWPGRGVVGAFGRVGGPDGSRFQVVGVVGDVRNDGFGKPTVPEIYLLSTVYSANPMRFVMRSPLPPATLVPEVRRAVQGFDPSLPIHDVSTMAGIASASVAVERVSSLMMLFFAAAALVMASLGIYGVVAYAVRQGTVEIGTRMALGAIGRELLALIVGGGLRMAAYGIVIGAVAIAAAVWVLVRNFEIHDIGAAPFVISTLIVGSVAGLASFFPAWRAVSLSPMVAIRNEPGAAWQSTRQSVRETLRGLSSALSLSADPTPQVTDDVLSAFVGAARGAASFMEAFHAALATLNDRLGASSSLLVEKAGDEYKLLAAAPRTLTLDRRLAADGFLVNRLRFYSFPLPIASRDVDGWLAWARGAHENHVAEIELLRGLDIRMAVAVRAREEILGLLLLGPKTTAEEYSDADKRVLRQCAEQLALMIENARLNARVLEQEKLRRDLALAAEVQKRLLPERPPQRDGAGLAAMSLPARGVGGDYYDFLDLGDQRIGIALADIAGKGIAAALIMAVVQASLRIVAAEGGTSLPQLAEKINGFLHRSTGSNSYATFFYAQLDERQRQLRYVNAGHNPPYLLRPVAHSSGSGAIDGGAEIRELSVGGTVLGLFPQMTYEEATVDLQSGDVLVAFTDGVTEALNTAEEEFGEERLKALLRSVVHLPAPEISSQIAQTLRLWIKDTAQYDDLTFVVMKVS
jgi:predicted permease